MNQSNSNERLVCVIVTHNRAEQLRTSLSNTLCQGVDRVVVIDNNSSDHTKEVLADFQSRYPRLVVKRQHRNRGGAWGFSQGIRNADKLLNGCGWVLLFDDDAWPERDCIARFRAHMLDYRRMGVTAVGAAVFDADNQVVEPNRPVLNLFRRPIEVLSLTAHHSHRVRDLYHVPVDIFHQRGIQMRVDSISFVGLFLNLEALPKGKGRYPHGGMFIYSDDTTYTLDLSRKDHLLLLDTDLIFRHNKIDGGAAGSCHIPSWKYYYMMRNSFLVNRSLSGFWYVPLCLASVVTHVRRGLLVLIHERNWAVITMVILGIIDGTYNNFRRSSNELIAMGRWP